MFIGAHEWFERSAFDVQLLRERGIVGRTHAGKFCLNLSKARFNGAQPGLDRGVLVCRCHDKDVTSEPYPALARDLLSRLRFGRRSRRFGFACSFGVLSLRLSCSGLRCSFWLRSLSSRVRRCLFHGGYLLRGGCFCSRFPCRSLRDFLCCFSGRFGLCVSLSFFGLCRIFLRLLAGNRAVLGHELLDPSFSIDELLIAGKEWMAGRANLDVELFAR